MLNFVTYRYVGDAEVFIINCPTDARADAECMTRWLKEGLLDEDDMYKDACKELKVSNSLAFHVPDGCSMTAAVNLWPLWKCRKKKKPLSV